jgi:hypothetical protein
LTQRSVRLGFELGLSVLDHVIAVQEGYFSLLDAGLLRAGIEDGGGRSSWAKGRAPRPYRVSRGWRDTTRVRSAREHSRGTSNVNRRSSPAARPVHWVAEGRCMRFSRAHRPWRQREAADAALPRRLHERSPLPASIRSALYELEVSSSTHANVISGTDQNGALPKVRELAQRAVEGAQGGVMSSREGTLQVPPSTRAAS